MFANMFEPHPPYNGPLNNLYNPDKIPVGPLFLTPPSTNIPAFNLLRSRFHSVRPSIEEARSTYGIQKDPRAQHDNLEDFWRGVRARYFGNVTLLDRSIAPILETLNETEQSENTIIVFTSDHGDSLGDRGMSGKRSFYEEVARVPLIIHVPWLGDTERHVGGSIGQIDLVPTLLDLLGEKIPDHVQGHSRRNVLDGTSTLTDDVFMQWHGGPATVSLGNAELNRLSEIPWRSVVSRDRWKLNLSTGDNCELYDLNKDPLELINLYHHPDHVDQVRYLTQKILNWQPTFVRISIA